MSNSHDASLPQELPEIPGGWSARSITVGTETFHVWLPSSPDAFLDDPQVQLANREHDYMPYWAYLWPTAEWMARKVLEADWPVGTAALELGCGVGLVGLAAQRSGLHVTFTDYDANAVQVAQLNLQHNTVRSQSLDNSVSTPPDAAHQELDWRDLSSVTLPRFPVILGCDIVYEPGVHAPVLNTLQRLLQPEGVCWIGDPGRLCADQFVATAREQGFHVNQVAVETVDVDRPKVRSRWRIRFRMLEVRHG